MFNPLLNPALRNLSLATFVAPGYFLVRVVDRDLLVDVVGERRVDDDVVVRRTVGVRFEVLVIDEVRVDGRKAIELIEDVVLEGRGVWTT